MRALRVVEARGARGQRGSGQLRRARAATERVRHVHVQRVELRRQLVLERRVDRQVAVVRAHAVPVALAHYTGCGFKSANIMRQ